MTTKARGCVEEPQRYTFPAFEKAVEFAEFLLVERDSLLLDNMESEMPPLASLLFNGYNPIQPKRNLSGSRAACQGGECDRKY